MSWHDYYRFRYSLLRRKREFSELPGLRGRISGWGILLVVASIPLSGVRGLRAEITGGYAASVALVALLWFVAALGEYFPKSAAWMVLILSIGAAGLSLYFLPSVLENSWFPMRDGSLSILFVLYAAIVAFESRKQILELGRASAV